MRIMIVDDEVIIRTGLASVIQWHELGLELLEPAASAEEALGRMPQERPNIVLTDIRMTGRSGLELAEETRRRWPDTEVIILSGYDDFKYTQQAIRQGVADYLLKTSSPEEIMKTVLEAKQRIEEKQADSRLHHYKSKEARNRLFERWVVEGDTAGISGGMLSSSLPWLRAGDDPLKLQHQVLLITAEGWGDSSASARLLLFAVENTLNDMLLCETLNLKERVVVVRAVEGTARMASRDEALLGKIERLLKCRLFTGAGKPVNRIEELHESYLTAEHAFGYKGIVEGSVCRYDDVRNRRGGKLVCAYEDEVELFSILLEDHLLSLKEWVRRFICEQLADPQVTRESLEASIHSVVLSAYRWLERVHTASGCSASGKKSPPDFKLKWSLSPQEALFQQLYSVMKLYHGHLAEGQATHVQKALAFIEVNLENDIGLQQVAKHVHLHPGHLSDVFKKETGVTFVDYITRLKMRRAMEILTVSPAKISEVAAKVGYEDVKYFTQLFKKHSGRTPKDFREASRRKPD